MTTYKANLGYVRAGQCDIETVGILAAAGHAGRAERLNDLLQAVRLVARATQGMCASNATSGKELFAASIVVLDCSDETYEALLAARDALIKAASAYAAENTQALVDIGVLIQSA